MEMITRFDGKLIKELTNDQLIQRAKSIANTVGPAEGASEKYSFIPTLNIVNLLRDDGWIPVKVQEAITRLPNTMGFQRHMVSFTKPSLVESDKRFNLVLYNSHDRGSAFQLRGGIYRLVCSNGMVIGKDYMSFSHRHLNFEMDKFLESSRIINQGLLKIADKVEDWTKIKLERPEQLDFAYAAHNMIYGEREEYPVLHPTLLTPRRAEDTGNDLWSVYNVIQENVTKGGLNALRSDGRRMKTKPIRDIIRDKKINEGLWNMAETMEEWKTAA